MMAQRRNRPTITPGICPHCERRRCAGRCQRPICTTCGWRHYGNCESQSRKFIKEIKAIGQTPRPLLTPIQQDLLFACAAWLDEHGYGPSVRDLKAIVKASSTSVVNYNLGRLEAKGYITKAEGPGIARSVRMTDKGRRYCDENA